MFSSSGLEHKIEKIKNGDKVLKIVLCFIDALNDALCVKFNLNAAQ